MQTRNTNIINTGIKLCSEIWLKFRQRLFQLLCFHSNTVMIMPHETLWQQHIIISVMAMLLHGLTASTLIICLHISAATARDNHLSFSVCQLSHVWKSWRTQKETTLSIDLTALYTIISNISQQISWRTVRSRCLICRNAHFFSSINSTTNTSPSS